MMPNLPEEIKRKLRDCLFKVLEGIQMKVKSVSGGAYHVLAVTTDGMAFSWGRNDVG